MIKFLKLPVLEDVAQFKRHITLPIQQKKAKNSSDYRNLRVLLSSICLRRTKAVLPMTQSMTYTHRLNFTTEERDEYSRIERTCKEALDLAVSGHKVKEAHQNVLEILLRLRLFCNNGSVYSEGRPHSSPKPMDAGEAFSLLQQSDRAICYYCSCDIISIARSDNHDSVVVTNCRHAICSDCIPLWRSSTAKCTGCPICRSAHSLKSVVTESNEDVLSPTEFPSKLLALCRDIKTHKDEGKRLVPFPYYVRNNLIHEASSSHFGKRPWTLPALSSRPKTYHSFESMVLFSSANGRLLSLNSRIGPIFQSF